LTTILITSSIVYSKLTLVRSGATQMDSQPRPDSLTATGPLSLPFLAVARPIEDRWILTPGSTAGEIRRAFRMLWQSAVQASQGMASLGGFGR
jgi:hypothetical protein